MNFFIILRLTGIIHVTLGLAFLICLSVEYAEPITTHAHGEPTGWVLSASIAFLLGIFSFILGRRGTVQLFRKEAMAIIGLGWLSASALGALPYWFIIENCSWIDALYESTSGITTTGSSVFSNLDIMTPGLLFWRSISQWIGGIGIVVFFVAVLSFLGAGGKILYSRESSANASDIHSSKIQVGVLRILALYVCLTVACAIAYCLAGMETFDAWCHAFTAISTGGFSTHETSIAFFNSPTIEWISIVFMVLGGTSFLYFLDLWDSRLKKRHNTEVISYYLIIAISTAVIALSLLFTSSTSGTDALRQSAFQVVSIMTTTGFSTTDFDQWIPGAKIILLCLMVLGGCSGSTSGGIKVIRAILAMKASLLGLIKSYQPRVIKPVRINGIAIKDEALSASINYLILVAAFSFLAIPVLAIIESDLSMMGVISAYCASVFNIGPGFAEIGPTYTFENFSAGGKLILSFLMILGRVEFYALITLFMPSMWKHY